MKQISQSQTLSKKNLSSLNNKRGILQNLQQNQSIIPTQGILQNQRSQNKNPTSSNKNKKEIDYLKLIKSIKLEQDLRKIRNFKNLQQSMKKQKKQISQIEQQLQKVQQKILQKKKQLIQKHIEQLQQKKHQRQEFIQLTNKQLHHIKQKNQQKKKQIQSLVKEFQSKQLQKYQKTLKERINRYRNPINFDQIKTHQKKYLELKQQSQINKQRSSQIKDNLNKKQSMRVKSQIGSRYQNQFQNLSIDHKSRLDQRIRDQYKQARSKTLNKKSQIIKLITKRNQYGNRVQQQKKNVRFKTEQYQQTKRQLQSRLFWQKIQKENQQKKNAKKPKLNTNLPKIDIKDYTKLSLRKISQSHQITPFQKIQKLKSIQNLYLNKNNPQAYDIISQLSLIKADLYLKI